MKQKNREILYLIWNYVVAIAGTWYYILKEIAI